MKTNYYKKIILFSFMLMFSTFYLYGLISSSKMSFEIIFMLIAGLFFFLFSLIMIIKLIIKIKNYKKDERIITYIPNNIVEKSSDYGTGFSNELNKFSIKKLGLTSSQFITKVISGSKLVKSIKICLLLSLLLVPMIYDSCQLYFNYEKNHSTVEATVTEIIQYDEKLQGKAIKYSYLVDGFSYERVEKYPEEILNIGATTLINYNINSPDTIPDNKISFELFLFRAGLPFCFLITSLGMIFINIPGSIKKITQFKSEKK